METTHLRVIILHEFKLGHSVSEATQNIKMVWEVGSANERTCVDGTRSSVLETWTSKRRTVQDDHPKCDDGRLKERVKTDPQGTVREMGKELQASRVTISRHPEAIGKVKKLDKWVPHELTEKRQGFRLEICSSVIIRNENDLFLGRVITSDEKYCARQSEKISAMAG
ncbi:unnamed protein product [Heligmosomoides polygyrus]|uniref:HTH_48 domain-containing protein n=1 Tax=Heligmosomoides polygyrus TaxID=6339 RepID=A0A183FD99_HELPZ|nr:unnamed protein product [Heligmosomoides polygyrus]